MPHVIFVSSEIRCAGHVAHMGNGSYRNWFRGMDWIRCGSGQAGPSVRHGDELSDSITCGEF
jgi:hypothetical protein